MPGVPSRVLEALWELLLQTILQALGANLDVSTDFYGRFHFTLEVGLHEEPPLHLSPAPSSPSCLCPLPRVAGPSHLSCSPGVPAAQHFLCQPPLRTVNWPRALASPPAPGLLRCGTQAHLPSPLAPAPPCL